MNDRKNTCNHGRCGDCSVKTANHNCGKNSLKETIDAVKEKVKEKDAYISTLEEEIKYLRKMLEEANNER